MGIRAILLFAFLTLTTLAVHSATIHVAAAADLKYALSEIAGVYQQESGHTIALTFGSSGNIARQIPQGAPFELFLSADEEYIFKLAALGQLRDQGRLYAIGRIALFAPQGSPLTVDGELRDLRAAVADGRLQRLAIANPDHAPYGRAARAVLIHAGIWQALQGKLVLGENVTQAAQFALSGSAQGGIVAWSLSKSPELARRSTAALIPAGWHPPLRQRMALTRRAGSEAGHFFAYLQQPAARAIFARHGFALPDD